MGLFKSALEKVKKGLAKTRDVFIGGLRSILVGRKLSDELLEELERAMLQADMGVSTTMRLIDGLRTAYKEGKIQEGDQALEYLKGELCGYWPEADRSIQFADEGPTVILVVGINGAGKTTSIAKMAKSMKDTGRSVTLAACDTFRAAAVEQLDIWSSRLGVDIVKGQQGGDPAAVAFDACDAALTRGTDVLIVDTAGRLHTQQHLMRQLEKIKNVIRRKIPTGPHEVILVLDATTGQNAVQQAKLFSESAEVSGLFLSKLDGTARGGIVVAIREEMEIPVKFIGVGETPDDVEPFEPEKFVEALFSE